MAAAGYLRVSAEDAEQNTIDNQRLLVEGHCKLHGIPLVELYLDDGITGVMPFERRPEGQRLLRDARDKRFDTVFIYRLDRVGRDPRLILNIVEEFAGLGIRFVSLTETLDMSSPTGRLLMTILAGFAGFERDSILQRTRDGAERVASEGTYMGGIVPFGYRRVGERRTARIVPAEEPLPGVGMSEADVVRWVYRHVACELGSTITATKRLNELSVPTRYALGGFKQNKGALPCGQWTPATVYGILTKPIYRGVATYKKRDGTQIEQQVPALIEDDLWERAQQRLRDNAKFSRRNGKRDYLLRGLLRCSHCGHAYTGNCGSADGKPYPRYGCYSGTGLSPHRTRCRVRRLSAEPFEAWVWGKVEELLREPGALIAELVRRTEATSDDIALLTRDRERLSSEVSGKDLERKRILSLYRRQLINDAEVDEQLDAIKKEEMALQRRLHEIETRLSGSSDSHAHLEALRASIQAVAHEMARGDLPREKKRLLLEV
jgi:site-specific DNA recombinase